MTFANAKPFIDTLVSARNNSKSMRGRCLSCLYLILLTAALVFGCGDGDSSSNSGPDDDDDDTGSAADDDSLADDEVPDDDTGAGDDDAADDDTTDDDLEPLTCQPSPNIWSEPLPITGGPITDAIAAVVINDATCKPLAGATVVSGNSNIQLLTDENGAVHFTGETGPTLLTAHKDGFGIRAFFVNANHILFRLQPKNLSLFYADSAEGDFHLGGTDLEVTQAPFGLMGSGLVNNPVYFGLALPGISRQTALQTDWSNGLLTEGSFRAGIRIDALEINEIIDLPHNVWIPKVDGSVSFTNPGLNHPYFRVPENLMMEEMPLAGVVWRLNTPVLGLEGIADLINMINSGSWDSLDRDLIAQVQDVMYAGLLPAYPVGEAPAIEVATVAQSGLTTTVTRSGSLAGSNDYLAVLFAEVSGRGLAPLDISHLNLGVQTMEYALLPKADYFLLTIATQLLTEGAQNFSLTVTELPDPSAGGNVDGFVPYFEDVNYSAWEGACTLGWQPPAGQRENMPPNLITLMAYNRLADEILLADFPTSTTSFTVPPFLGWTCSTLDSGAAAYDIVLLAASYTAGLDIDERDYTAWLADGGGFSLNLSADLADLLYDLFLP